MHVLFLTNGFPYPLTSGRLRTYHLMRELARRHRVTLFSMAGQDYRPEHKTAVASFADRVEVFSAAAGGSRRNWRRILYRARGLATGLSPPLVRMQSAISEFLAQESVDAIVCSVATFPAIARVPTPPLIADVCDAVGMHIRDRIIHAGWGESLLLRLAHLLRQRLERRVFARVDHLLFATQRDLEAGAGEAVERASVVPNGVDSEYWKRGTNRLGRHTFLFTGVMQYAPNLDAARLLAEQILPRVRREVHDADLLLVGRDPPAALRRAAEQCGATVTGFVNDMRPYLERASLFAAPLRFGAGIQNKVLEAMSMELPVIASRRVADGLRTLHGDAPPLRQADEADDFAQAVIRGLLASDRDPRPDAAARAFVSAHFNWEGSGRRLEEAIDQAISVNCRMKPERVRQSV